MYMIFIVNYLKEKTTTETVELWVLIPQCVSISKDYQIYDG